MKRDRTDDGSGTVETSPELARNAGVGGPKSELSPEAARALAEAQERRRRRAAESAAREVGGRGGLDPARYGDWEVKGIASDF